MREIVGWMIFFLGFLIAFAGAAISKELLGNYTVGIIIGILFIGFGWALAHPKRKNE